MHNRYNTVVALINGMYTDIVFGTWTGCGQLAAQLFMEEIEYYGNNCSPANFCTAWITSFSKYEQQSITSHNYILLLCTNCTIIVCTKLAICTE